MSPPSSVIWQTYRQLKLRKAHCLALLRNRYDSGPLVVSAVLLVLLATADMVYQVTAPMPSGCSRDFFWGVGVPRACKPAYHTSMAFSIARLFLGTGGLVGVWAQRVLSIMFFTPGGYRDRPGEDDLNSLRRPNLSGKRVTATARLSDVRPWGSGSAGWALASSKQAWLETTGSVYASVAWMLSATLSVTSLLALINFVTALTHPGWTSGASWDYACTTCTDGDSSELQTCITSGYAPLNMCFLAWHARLVFPFLVAGQVVSLGLLTTLTPLRMWDPVAVEAGQATGLTWLRLVRVLHYPVALGIANMPAPLIAFSLMELHAAPRLLLVLSGYSSIICSALQLILAAWILRKGAQHQQSTSLREGNIFKSAWEWLCGLPKATYSALFFESAAGLNSKLQYQLVLIVLIFVAHISAFGAVYYSVVFIFRVGVVVVFVLTRDQQTDFKALRRDPNGAGFGLVVDASMLAEALRRYLENEPPLEHIHTYKATVYRMEATLAVSYRWQLEEAYICPGRALNMSRWQMERIVASLEDTSCFYVWIDRLSVPQYECELQNTLLSRMMATFASARETLVLRSLEDNGSRYHQRAWTLPEFVCSASPRIHTQEREGNGAAELKSDVEAWPANRLGHQLAVVAAEEKQVARVRKFYSSHLRHCRPLWLHPNGKVNFSFSLTEFEAVWEMYEGALGRLLNCSIPEDRIRAVYPLFFCVPVDNHEELVSLVDEVASLLAARNSPDAQVARRHYFEIMGAAVVDGDESGTEAESAEASLMGRVISNAANAFTFASMRALSAIHTALPNALDRFRQSHNLHSSARCGPIPSGIQLVELTSTCLPADLSQNGEWQMAATTPRSSAASVSAPG